MMTAAGTNPINQTAIKTRKQPLTVTAQFQNSLSALMDTLNQANPFFIRCIKSNSQKIPNKFDETTVLRQLRYTGMLETVRIRRAGYNVRLTYEEFIQLYRILLPKGLVSSQKDVKDFLNTMDLNKQHYQLGSTKIYMRESQKMRLDIKLHKKIVDSIILIQKWFCGILQRRKFLTYRAAAITIQSYWRMYSAQKLVSLRRLQFNAAIVIQATWRMHKEMKWYRKIKSGVLVFQAHIRGYLARERYKTKKLKMQKDRNRLRSTQSLPNNERSPPLRESASSSIDEVKRSFSRTHYSLDSNLEDVNKSKKSYLQSSANSGNSENSSLIMVQSDEVLEKAGNQLRSLMISSGNNNRAFSFGNENYYNPPHYQNIPNAFDKNISTQQQRQHQAYFKDKSSTKCCDDSMDILRRHEFNKMPVRRTDSGPPLRYDVDYEDIGDLEISKETISPNKYLSYSVPSSSKSVETVPPISEKDAQQLVKFGRRDSHKKADEELSHQVTSQQQRCESVDTLSSSTVSVSSVSMKSPSYQATPYQRGSYPKQVHSLDETKSSSSTSSSALITPRGKAAALLGSISEDRGQSSSGAIITSRLQKQQPIKGRRVKSNLSDEITTTSISKVSHVPKPTDEYSSDSLKRRNSDPSSTNKVPLLEVNRGNDMYQSSTQITIAGHRFRKAARIGKAEKCASCQESDAFVNEGYRCLDCKVLVHTKCIQNGGVKTLTCEAKRSKRLRKNEKTPHTPNSKYSGTREYTDSTDRIISDAKELKLMDDFITQKIHKMNENEGEKCSEVDRVFKQALKAFKDTLVTQYSVAHKQNSDSLNIKYRDLIDNFGQVMETCCGKKNDFPITMGMNAFRGFMNEFMNSRETEKPKAKRKKDKKRKIEEHTSFNGHTFQLTIINIPTACEICTLFLLWPIERGLVCQNCRLTCHKKCYQKASACNKISPTQSSGSGSASNLPSDSKLFGMPLTSLCISEGAKIPVQIDQLITKIEMLGLYSEGIYRKSGVNSKIKELKLKMSETSSASEIDYESYNVHVLANVLKSFLRDMPEPLLTFDRYDDFLRAADLPDTNVRVQTILSLIKKLPPSHHFLLERLIFHLALVAQREKHNRMSASSLAIVFAPCVLRTNRIVPAQDSLNDIGRQTRCIETLITQKMLNVRSTLADIDTLDTAAHTATTRLSTLRSSKVFSPEELSAPRTSNLESETEEMILEGHIQEIKKEKALLTSALPNLVRASSDDDLLSTDLEGEGGSLDDLSAGGGGSASGCGSYAGSRDKDSFLDNREMKDSIDSSLGSLVEAGCCTPNSKRSVTLDMTDSIAIGNICREHYETDSTVDSIGLSYNLRDQNIDYIPSPRHLIALSSDQHQQQDLQQQGSKNVTPSSSGSTSTISILEGCPTGGGGKYSINNTLLKSSSSSLCNSAAIGLGTGPSNNSTSIRWTGSQQNLSHTSLSSSILGSIPIGSSGNTGTGSNNSSTTAPIITSSTMITGSTTKPIAIRSMSGGYETMINLHHHHQYHHQLSYPHSHSHPYHYGSSSINCSPRQSFSSSHSNIVSSNPAGISSAGTFNSNKSASIKDNNSPSSSSNKNSSKTNNNNNNSRHKKKQSSLDDEPIMV